MTTLSSKMLLTLLAVFFSVSICAAHCPSLNSIHLNKFGYYVAPGGWKSIHKGDADMQVLDFQEATQATNIETFKRELNFCVYEVGFKGDNFTPKELMFLKPTKQHLVDVHSKGWQTTEELGMICKYDDPKKNIPENCHFS